mgnify:CR=1 FL=1
MANLLLSIGTPYTRRIFVIILYLALTWILVGNPPNYLNPTKQIFGSIDVGWILAALLWLTFFWIKRHSIQ